MTFHKLTIIKSAQIRRFLRRLQLNLHPARMFSMQNLTADSLLALIEKYICLSFELYIQLLSKVEYIKFYSTSDRAID